jgi:hypothetical protein
MSTADPLRLKYLLRHLAFLSGRGRSVATSINSLRAFEIFLGSIVVHPLRHFDSLAGISKRFNPLLSKRENRYFDAVAVHHRQAQIRVVQMLGDIGEVFGIDKLVITVD